MDDNIENNEDIDAVDSETLHLDDIEEETPKNTSRANIFAALRAAVSAGNMSKRQAGDIQRQLGISQSYFTRKILTRAERKAKRTMQKNSRRVNRGNGKGHKQSGRV